MLELDYLHDFIAVRGYILLTKSGEQMYVAEYRRLVEQRILELVTNHPTIKAIQQGRKIDDWQLLELERTLTKELGEGDLEVTPENLKKVFAHTADSFLGLVRQVLDMQYLPDYKDLVARQFESYVTQHNYNADQFAFCAPCKACSCRNAISKPPTCMSRRWICLARMRWSGGLRRKK